MRKIALYSLLVAFALSCALPVAQSQEKAADQSDSSKSSADNKSQVDQRGKAVAPYRLDFSFNETESGKKVNSRHYTVIVAAGSANEVKVGTRVPIATTDSPNPGPAQFQYLDLGTSVWALLRDVSGDIQLEVRSEISWTKHEDVDVSPRTPHTTFTPPIVSQIKINGSTLLQTGKPIIIGAADDPYSNREFQLEVTATKLK